MRAQTSAYIKRAAVLTFLLAGSVSFLAAQGPSPDKLTEKPPRKHLVLGMPGFELGDPNKAPKECAVEGKAQGAPGVVLLLAPQLTKFYGRSPLFRWSGMAGAEGFELVVRDESDYEILRQRVSEQYYRPESSQAFQPGKTYFWTVRPYPDTRKTIACVAGFRVLTKSERTQVDDELASISSADRFEVELVRAQILANHRLWYDAIGAYSDLIQRFPDRAEPYEQRGSIYAQVDETKPLGDADLARADALKAGSSR